MSRSGNKVHAMNFSLKDPGPSLTREEIEMFEQEIGGQIPGDYKQFLLACNGGVTEPTVGLSWNGKVEKVPYFDPLLPTSERGLRCALANLHELNIEGLLPITSTQNMDDICLSVQEDVGRITLAKFVYENEIPVGANMFRLAGSFTEFLDSLFPIPVVYCPIEDMGKQGTPEDLDRYLAEGNSIDEVGKNGFTIICEAIKCDNMPLIEACIEHGASLAGTVRMAVINRRRDVVRKLVASGADVNEQDEFGDRPLYHIGARCYLVKKVL